MSELQKKLNAMSAYWCSESVELFQSFVDAIEELKRRQGLIDKPEPRTPTPLEDFEAFYMTRCSKCVPGELKDDPLSCSTCIERRLRLIAYLPNSVRKMTKEEFWKVVHGLPIGVTYDDVARAIGLIKEE